MVCQLEIIGRQFTKYVRALARCRNLLNSALIASQQEGINSPFADYWQTVHKICSGTNALPQSFRQCRNSCSMYGAPGVCQTEEIGRLFTYFVNGLPIISYWQTIQSANNLLLTDHNGLPITPIFPLNCIDFSFSNIFDLCFTCMILSIFVYINYLNVYRKVTCMTNHLHSWCRWFYCMVTSMPFSQRLGRHKRLPYHLQ